MWLAGNPGTTGQDTAAGTGMDRMSVSRNLRSMERKGMVVRVEDAADRKRWNWQLTGAGWEIYDEILPSALARDKLLTRDLSEDTRATILAFLENSLAGLDRKDG